MAPSSRDRISVDLGGLKAALYDRAQALGTSPSALVRTTLVEALGAAQRVSVDTAVARPCRRHRERIRVCLRMSREQASAMMEAARRAGMSPGDFVGGLVADVPMLRSGCHRAEHIGELTASSAELATLSRNVHRLTALLQEAGVETARPYRQMLETLERDVHRHLELAARALADLQPRRRGPKTATFVNA
jgi:hypothetical protein